MGRRIGGLAIAVAERVRKGEVERAGLIEGDLPDIEVLRVAEAFALDHELDGIRGCRHEGDKRDEVGGIILGIIT